MSLHANMKAKRTADAWAHLGERLSTVGPPPKRGRREALGRPMDVSLPARRWLAEERCGRLPYPTKTAPVRAVA